MDIGEDLVVVGPGRVREVDGLVRLGVVEPGKEERAKVDGAGSRNRLQAGDLFGVSVGCFLD